MSYPKTGEEVYVSLNLSNTMLTGLGKGTITREDVSVAFYYGMIQLQRKVKIEKFFGGVNRKEKKPDYLRNEE